MIQSVMTQSEAYEQGMRPLMKVTKFDSLDFEKGADFCDFVYSPKSEKIFLEVEDAEKKKRVFNLEKKPLK